MAAKDTYLVDPVDIGRGTKSSGTATSKKQLGGFIKGVLGD